MLFKTIEEIKEHHGKLTLSFSFKDLKPYIKTVEEDYIIPAISQEEYELLQEDYNVENPMPLAQKKLLDKVRDVIAPLSLHYYMASAMGIHGQNGFFIVENQEQIPAPKWMVDRTQADAHTRGMKAADRLYAFLEINKADYPHWADSDSFTIFKSNFINSVDEFEKHIKIGKSRRTFLSLRPIMDNVEVTRIESALSPDLFDEIKEQILDGEITTANKKLLTRYIQPAVAQLTMAAAIMELPITIDEHGASLYEEEKKALSMDQKSTISNNSKSRGEIYLSDLQKYIYQNADNYPAFKNSTSYNPSGDDYYTPGDGNVAAFL
jgi:hypothetical protein